jgi:hypothetical protein
VCYVLHPKIGEDSCCSVYLRDSKNETCKTWNEGQKFSSDDKRTSSWRQYWQAGQQKNGTMNTWFEKKRSWEILDDGEPQYPMEPWLLLLDLKIVFSTDCPQSHFFFASTWQLTGPIPAELSVLVVCFCFSVSPTAESVSCRMQKKCGIGGNLCWKRF